MQGRGRVQRVVRATIALGTLGAVLALIAPAIASAGSSPVVAAAVSPIVRSVTELLTGPVDPGPILLLLVAGGLATLGVLSGPMAATEAAHRR